jgi:DNA-directed RNA polymerase specialized sigma24 family protein
MDYSDRVHPGQALTWPVCVPTCEDDVIELLEPTPHRNGVPSVEALLRGLTHTERVVVRMRVLEGASYSECGEALGITKQGAHRAYQRALVRLRGRPELQRWAAR